MRLHAFLAGIGLGLIGVVLIGFVEPIRRWDQKSFASGNLVVRTAGVCAR